MQIKKEIVENMGKNSEKQANNNNSSAIEE